VIIIMIGGSSSMLRPFIMMTLVMVTMVMMNMAISDIGS
jgi:hypothetical protein